MRIKLSFALTMLAVIGCEEPADQTDACGEWTNESLAAAYELGEELDCGTMNGTTTQAAAEAVLACMNGALDSGQPAKATHLISYEDGVYDRVHSPRDRADVDVIERVISDMNTQFEAIAS